ncbi:transposase [Streptomyces avermitilis]|uniref:transposase n=1 Tax=Streptomyces avermitilis TaxID=33903 RepID=UPI00381BD753
MLLLADRGFLGFELWRAAAATGADLLWRAKSNAVSASFEDGSYLSRIAAADDRKRTNPITVSVVEYSLGPRGKDNTVYRLVTTLLDPGSAPAAELAALYAERWEIESTLDEIKTHLGGPRPVPALPAPSGRRTGDLRLSPRAPRPARPHAPVRSPGRPRSGPGLLHPHPARRPPADHRPGVGPPARVNYTAQPRRPSNATADNTSFRTANCASITGRFEGTPMAAHVPPARHRMTYPFPAE